LSVASATDGSLEIDARDLADSLARPDAPVVIDVRSVQECAFGTLQDARCVPHRELAARIGEVTTDRGAALVLYCASGVRSADGARELRALGYGRVRSLRGGIEAWQRAGFPVRVPEDAALTTLQRERFSRQLRLPEVGVAGQRKLLDARVLCIGAGGLGSPALLYLAAAGVGHIGIVDDDTVQLSNLHRQVVHATERIGMAKTASAAVSLGALNPDVEIVPHRLRLERDNAAALCAAYDVIVDGSDNFPTRYLVNDATLAAGKPLVSGAILGFEGQVGVFEGAPCYRCVFPAAPPAEFAPSCDAAGVLGVVPGLVGLVQAAETLKLLLGIGEPLRRRLLVVDVLTMRFSELRIEADPACGCGNVVRSRRGS
jgi:molybdopterin/thiamine biosynthesis adenylyltransferase/rhodanese-related sulfurtransferase